MENYLIIDRIDKQYGRCKVLENISLVIRKGEFVSLLGPSGCGKTTLLKIIAGIESAASGRIIMNGRDITELAPDKRNIGLVFQSYALFPNMTVEENIAFGLECKKLSSGIIKNKVMDILDVVHLQEYLRRYPSQLSGGQQQRVALARALVLSPDILLLDEPLSALDARVRLTLRNEIKRIQKETNITTIMVTHDQDEALTISDRIAVMHNGLLMQEGRPETIYENPVNPFVADFIGEINFIKKKHKQNDTLYAIRPEHVEMSEDKNDTAVRIVSKEYKGLFYKMTGQFVSMVQPEYVTFYATDEQCRRYINQNHIVNLRFPESKMIKYTQDQAHENRSN